MADKPDKHPGGRPPLFTDPADIERIGKEYYAQRVADDIPPTINGLAVALGMCRDSLNEYRKKPEFSDAMKTVLTPIQDWWERKLSGTSPTGTIFWLKNQGWTDERSVKQELTGKDGGPLEIQNKSDDELIAELRRLSENDTVRTALGLDG